MGSFPRSFPKSALLSRLLRTSSQSVSCKRRNYHSRPDLLTLSLDDLTNEISDLTGSFSALLSGLEGLGLTNILGTVTGLLSNTGTLSTVTGLLGGLPLGL